MSTGAFYGNMLTRENFGQQRRFLTVSTLPFLFFLRLGVGRGFIFLDSLNPLIPLDREKYF